MCVEDPGPLPAQEKGHPLSTPSPFLPGLRGGHAAPVTMQVLPWVPSLPDLSWGRVYPEAQGPGRTSSLGASPPNLFY